MAFQKLFKPIKSKYSIVSTKPSAVSVTPRGSAISVPTKPSTVTSFKEEERKDQIQYHVQARRRRIKVQSQPVSTKNKCSITFKRKKTEAQYQGSKTK